MNEVEQPEALAMKVRCENRGVLWAGGGLGDQPHLLMLEWDVIDSARLKAIQSQKKSEEILAKISAKAKVADQIRV